VRRWVAIVVSFLAACGGDDDSSLVVELLSEVSPLDAVVIGVYGQHGAILLDQQLVDGGALDLPRRVRIEGGVREESIRILAWGERDDARVAFGHSDAELVRGEEDVITILLEPPPSDCDDDGVPDTLDGCVAVADPSQADADGDGVTDACTINTTCPGNLATNPGFEAGTTGWNSSTGTLTQFAGGHTGSSAGRLCKTPTGTEAEYYFHDEPKSVPAPPMGAQYHVDAWVKAEIDAGQRVDLRLGEFTIAGNDPVDSQISGVTATSSWQRLSADLAVSSAPGTSYLDVRFRVMGAIDGTCFEVDDVCVQRVAAACP
jgi:hypothetical protein